MEAFEKLRRLILSLSPTGEDAFEGLVCHALSFLASTETGWPERGANSAGIPLLVGASRSMA
jgi:hypothetical protein